MIEHLCQFVFDLEDFLKDINDEIINDHLDSLPVITNDKHSDDNVNYFPQKRDQRHKILFSKSYITPGLNTDSFHFYF